MFLHKASECLFQSSLTSVAFGFAPPAVAAKIVATLFLCFVCYSGLTIAAAPADPLDGEDAVAAESAVPCPTTTAVADSSSLSAVTAPTGGDVPIGLAPTLSAAERYGGGGGGGEGAGGRTESYPDAARSFLQRLSRDQEEGYALPSGSVHVQPYCGVRGTSGLLILNGRIVGVTLVLTQDDVGGGDGGDGFQDGHLGVADALGGVMALFLPILSSRRSQRGGFHRQQSQNLQEMILDDVPHDPVPIEVSAPSLRTEILLPFHRDAPNRPPVPQVSGPIVPEPECP
mmetsp:Transcript_62309/g.184362  ORF Transcript_62309/g.184362 Transcript_62309/m.184362 type:complete len:286 (-) Transcript_62309:1076-1933(-)